MSRQDNEKTNNFKSQHEKGRYDKESVVDKRNEVATPNAVDNKTARQPGRNMELRSRHRIY